MSKSLPGEHLCEKHQGNHSHYATENCTICKLQAQATAQQERYTEVLRLLREARGVIKILIGPGASEATIDRIDAILARG